MKNWWTNLDATKSNYNDKNCDKCEVHTGFWKAEQQIIQGALTEVEKLAKLHDTRKVKTTGHSLGAAIANLAAMDFLRAGYEVSMYNFG